MKTSDAATEADGEWQSRRLSYLGELSQVWKYHKSKFMDY